MVKGVLSADYTYLYTHVHDKAFKFRIYMYMYMYRGYTLYTIFLNERDIYQNRKKHRNKIGMVPCFGNKIKYHFHIKHHFHITTVHNDCFFVFCLYSRHVCMVALWRWCLMWKWYLILFCLNNL